MAEPADKSKTTGEHDVRSIVENANAEDENTKSKGKAGAEDDDDAEDDDAEDDDDDADSDDDEEEDDEEDSDEEDDSEDDDSEDDEDADSKKSKSSDKKSAKFRYSQFAGDGSEKSYRKNLEEAYKNSSAEGVRLNQEVTMQKRRLDNLVSAASKDPELATKLNALLSEGGSGTGTGDGDGKAPTGGAENPFLRSAEADWKRNSEKEAQDFIDANPEVVSDPKINADVKDAMEMFSEREYKKNGRLMGAGEAMEKAYKYLGLDDKRTKNKVISEAKKSAAPTRPAGSKKKPKTASDFTEGQLAFADAMGVSKDKLAKYAK